MWLEWWETGNSYEKAKLQLNSEDTPALDAKIEELNRSNQIAKEWVRQWDVAQGKDRQYADNLLKWFEIGSMSDMYAIKYTDKPKSFNNQEVNLSQPSSGENLQDSSTQTSQTPEQKAKIESTIKSIPTSWDNGNVVNKEEIQKTLDKVASLFPQKLGDFIKKFFAIFSGTPDKSTEGIKKDISNLFNNSESKRTLDKYAFTVKDGEKGGTKIQFPEPAKITGDKTETPDSSDKKAKKLDIKDGTIDIGKDSKISTVTEADGKLYLVVENPDKTISTFMVENSKKIETPTATA